jgi:hypothetical protein
MLREHLPRDLDEMVREVAGGRSPDGSIDHVAEEVTRLESTTVESDTRDVLEKFKEGRGQHDRVADGPDEVTAALNESRVQLLLGPGDADDSGDGPTAWFGADPIPVARSQRQLADLGVSDVREGRLVDVLYRAALGTGAGVRVVPSSGGPQGGVGALLRW